MSNSDEQARKQLAEIARRRGELRPRSNDTISNGAYSGLYVATDFSHIHLNDIVVLGEIWIWGSLVTGRIFTYRGQLKQRSKNTVTITVCTPQELYDYLFPA